jgi:hypothetical protein
LLGTRVVKVDGSSVDSLTSAKFAAARLVCAPVTLFVEPMPLLVTKKGRDNKQFTHNALSGTIVVHETVYE